MFTIKELLELDLIPWYKNLTGMKIPDNRPIEFVSVNDLPLDNFIRKNEMVISIATPYVKDETLMTEFIEGLIKAKASLFLLAIPSDSGTLSFKNIEIAQKGGLPILLIPWDVRFADICETVLNRLRIDYNEAAEQMKILQADVLQCFLNDASLDDAARIISRNLNATISITNKTGQLLAGKNGSPSRTQIPLNTNGHVYGHLYIDTFKTQKAINLLSYTISPLLSLWFYKNELIETSRQIAKDDLIWGLANGSGYDSDSMRRAAKLMNLHLNKTYACIVGQVHLNGNFSDDWEQNWIDSNINSIRQTFTETAYSLQKEVMVTYQKNMIIAYLEINPTVGKTQISTFLDLVEKEIKTTSKSLVFSWGISEIKGDPTDFRNYYLHAKLAVELCSNDTGFRKRYYYENTLIYEILSTLSTNEDFLKNAYDILTPIMEYDKNKNMKLMDTLRIYLIYKSISEASRKLGRHRQTLIYQLEKIEDLTGLSLKNNDDLFLLEVCVRLTMDLSLIE